MVVILAVKWGLGEANKMREKKGKILFKILLLGETMFPVKATRDIGTYMDIYFL